MDLCNILHTLLYEVFIDIRVSAYTNEDTNLIFHKADLFHNLPLQLNRVVKGELSYDDVLATLRQRAQEKGCRQWLERRVAAIAESRA
jgi:hypothetical protein